MPVAVFATEPEWLPRVISIRLALPVVMLAVLWAWETLRPFFELQETRNRHAVRNLTLAVCNAVAVGVLFGAATVATATWTIDNGFGLLQLTGHFAVARFAAGLILLDGWMYAWHRLNHGIPLLWRFHRMHHSDPDMDITTATRFHLGEHVISASLRLMLIPVIGLSVWQIVVYEMAVIAMTHFHHANISVGHADRWLRCLVVTPDMHKVHHSRSQPETDSNYAVVLSFWDRLARTFRLTSDPHSIAFGLDEFADDQWQTVGGMLRTPFAGRDHRGQSQQTEDEPESRSEVTARP